MVVLGFGLITQIKPAEANVFKCKEKLEVKPGWLGKSFDDAVGHMRPVPAGYEPIGGIFASQALENRKVSIELAPKPAANWLIPVSPQ